jgi:predicted small lipoprotein YifL
MRRAALAAACAALAAAGCGQKGPLYLPDKSAKVVTTAPPAETAPPADATQPAATRPPKPHDQDQDSQPPPK